MFDDPPRAGELPEQVTKSVTIADGLAHDGASFWHHGHPRTRGTVPALGDGMKTTKSEKIEGAIKSAEGERRLTKAIERYARRHNEYARTVRQNTTLCAAAVREWNEYQDQKSAAQAA